MFFELHDPNVTELSKEQLEAAKQATMVDLGGCESLTTVPNFPKATWVSLRDCEALTTIPKFPEVTRLFVVL
jgi:hypothetical protein